MRRFSLCQRHFAPTLLYRFPLRTLERHSRHSTDRAIISAVQGARRHLLIRTVVGVGFWLLVSLVALGTLATTLPFLLLLLAILAILMWRVGVGRAGVGLLSRRRLGLPLV